MRHGDAWRIGCLLGAALVWAGACGTTSGSGESESHFLSVCTASTDCGGDLQCICGVCSQLCADDASCETVSSRATCEQSAECGGPLSVCDVVCASDADCAGVSGASVCSIGRCRSAAAEGGTIEPRDASAPDETRPDSAGSTTDSAVSTSNGDRPDSALPTPDASDVDASISGTVPFLEWQGGAVALNDGGVAECCFPGVITWYRDGDGSDDVHTLSDCGAYGLVSARGAQCTSSMPPCGASGITPFDVANAMNDSAVRNAVLAAPVTYGQDLRASGTAAQVLSIDGHEIVVGAPCSGASGCVDPPSALLSLLDVLRLVGDRMLGTGTCRPVPGCYRDPDPGPCDGAFQRYYYNGAKCEPFTYGGCGGNDNKFETLQMCEDACDFDPCLLGEGQAPPPLDAGGRCDGGTYVWGADGGRCIGDPVVLCLCRCQSSGNCDRCW